jgi:hypothetical protein
VRRAPERRADEQAFSLINKGLEEILKGLAHCLAFTPKEKTPMRKVLLTLAALAAFGIALPVASDSANAATVIIKKGHRDNGWHRGYHRDRVVVREGRRHRHGAALIVR